MRHWLKTLREQKNITMKSMGDFLGISESYYCAIEKGERQKKMDMTLASGLAAILGVPIADVVNYESEWRNR